MSAPNASTSIYANTTSEMSYHVRNVFALENFRFVQPEKCHGSGQEDIGALDERNLRGSTTLNSPLLRNSSIRSSSCT